MDYPEATEDDKAIEIQSIMLSKTIAEPGEEITAEVEYRNNSDEAVARMLKLYVNGVVVRYQRIYASPHSEGSANIAIPSRRFVGNYTIKAGDRSQTLTIS